MKNCKEHRKETMMKKKKELNIIQDIQYVFLLFILILSFFL